jgi:hypothetical protein
MPSIAEALQNYRPGAPVRNRVGRGTYKIFGVVRNFRTGEPVVGAEIEYWQAFRLPNGQCTYSQAPRWNYRGKTYTNGAGYYEIYTDCSCKEDKHIHLRVTAQQYEPLILRHTPAPNCPPQHRLDIVLNPLPYFTSDSGGGGGGSAGYRPGRGFVPPTPRQVPEDTSPDEAQYRKDWLDYITGGGSSGTASTVGTGTGYEPGTTFETRSGGSAATVSFSPSGGMSAGGAGTVATTPGSYLVGGGSAASAPAGAGSPVYALVARAQEAGQTSPFKMYRPFGNPALTALAQGVKAEIKNTPPWAWALIGLPVLYFVYRRKS